MKRVVYRDIDTGTGYYGILVALGVVIAAALGAAWYMEHHGHIVTGMTNQIVWGLPHIFAVFLIVTASGVLNVASIASVFGRDAYKPMARMSGLLAIAMLVGGLAVLVLDLGRPDRLIIAMTHFNFQSIFAWNIFLYTGFLAIVAAYLFVQMDRGIDGWTKPVGWFAFVWRLALTTGTGSIFGWLVAREAYDAAIMAPLFVAMSLSYGLAVFLLVITIACKLTKRTFGDEMLRRMARLLGIFAGAVLYFTAVQHLTGLYAAEHGGVVHFILFNGGIYTNLFWIGQVLIGGLIPILLIYLPQTGSSRPALLFACVLIIAGGFCQLYGIIIGGQAFPMVMFPGMEVTSSIGEGKIAAYAPSLPEFLLGLGGVALALSITVVGTKVLRILPTTLADAPSNG